jgi:hypothetical protein
VYVSASKKTQTQEPQTQELQKDSVNINSTKECNDSVEDYDSLKDIAKDVLKNTYKYLNAVVGGLLGAAIGTIGFSTIFLDWLPAFYINRIDTIVKNNKKTAAEKTFDIAVNLLLCLPIDVILNPMLGCIAGLLKGAFKGYNENFASGLVDVEKIVKKYHKILKDLSEAIKNDPNYYPDLPIIMEIVDY